MRKPRVIQPITLPEDNIAVKDDNIYTYTTSKDAHRFIQITSIFNDYLVIDIYEALYPHHKHTQFERARFIAHSTLSAQTFYIMLKHRAFRILT